MRTTALLGTLAALCLPLSSAAAQSAPCLSENDLTNSVVGSIFGFFPSGPGIWAWQITAPSSTVVQSGRIYTTNSYVHYIGPHMKLEIWDDDPTSPGQPGSRLGGGTWRIRTQTSWQGCNFDSPVALQANAQYWIVMHEPGWSTPPIQTGGSALPMMRLSGGTWLNMPSGALKYRLFCGNLDDAGVVAVGAGCPGSTGSVPGTFTNYSAQIGNSQFALEASGFGPGAITLQAFGLLPNYPAIPIPGTPGCFLQTNLDVVLSGMAGTGGVRDQTASGHVRTPFPIPGSPVLSGFYFTSQMAGIDLGLANPLPVVTTNTLQITVN